MSFFKEYFILIMQKEVNWFSLLLGLAIRDLCLSPILVHYCLGYILVGIFNHDTDKNSKCQPASMKYSNTDNFSSFYLQFDATFKFPMRVVTCNVSQNVFSMIGTKLIKPRFW